MKPKIVGRERRIFQGNEVDVDVTCCEDNMRRIRGNEERVNALNKLFDLMRPELPHGWILINPPGIVTEMNFCPTCGTPYKEKP